MKKLIVLSLLFLSATLTNAQEFAEQKEKLESMKVGFITKELDLTPEEAQKFWPVYNQREAELETIRTQMRQLIKGKKIDEMSDAEVEKMIQEQLTLKQKELDIEKNYNSKFKEVLPIKKVAKLYHAEHKFKGEVMRQWKEKHAGEGPGPRGGGRR